MAEQSPTETFPPRTRAELRMLTAIRGLGALYVMLFHAYFFFVTAGKAPTDAAAAMDGDRWVFRLPFVGHGYLGVELFFILSGYVMYYVYADTFASAPSGRLSAFRSFMFHRVARIYPLHAVVLTAVLVLKLLAAQHAPALASSNPDAPDPATTLLNYLLLQRIIPCPSIIIPAWSLSVEMFSYALFPLMLALLVSGGVATAVAAALAFAALSVVQAYSNGILHNFTERYFPLLRGGSRLRPRHGGVPAVGIGARAADTASSGVASGPPRRHPAAARHPR